METYLVFSSEFCVAVSEMTAVALDAIFVLRVMFAQRRLIQVVQLLTARLRRTLYDGLLAVCGTLRCRLALGLHCKFFFSLLILFLRGENEELRFKIFGPRKAKNSASPELRLK